ncbi:hypothetical protein PsYK624_012710 [Phanerochaete sordida]|uniref:RRM domain-containing protein n=1 Tax=Phanerochaete sordida TaxID=48140 RepID=A0A9P3FZ09_9APHY|nr:hypothetical protein PsYK624_012710 [Phanerochaete sordida]
MIVHGVGSLNSPIVISDDEDEAYVELELEQRLSSPQEGMALDFEDDYHPEYVWHDTPPEEREFARQERLSESVLQDATPDGSRDHGTPGSSLAGQKRKRGSHLDSPSQRSYPLPGQTHMAQPRPSSPGAYPGESKAARKKRRKRERQAAEYMVHASAGPSTGAMHPLPAIPAMFPPSMSPVSPVMPQIPSLLPFSLHASLPPKPMMFPDYGFPLPPISLQDLHIAAAMSMFPASPPIPPSIPPPFVNMHHMSLPPADLPVLPNEPLHPASDEPEPIRKTPIVKRPIGVPPDPDPSSLHGTYKSPNPNFPPPNPARTLVMEISPKKYRNVAFVRSWAMTFGTKPIKPPRIDLDVKAGKALIEFPTAEVARLAFESDRMLGEGREHIRVFWYRVRGVGADAGVGELEEGEIEDGELAKHHGKLKQKAKESKKAAEPTSFASLPVVDLPLPAKRLEHPRPSPLIIPPLPSPSNIRRTSVSQSPVALVNPARSPAVSSATPRQSTLPPLPASLPPKPVSLRQTPAAKPLEPSPPQPPPLLSRIQQAEAEPRLEVFAVSIAHAPTPPSSLDANAPVFVPKALSHSSTPAPVDPARLPPPSSSDIPGLHAGLDASGASAADGAQTGSKRTAAERGGATPEPVRNVIAQAIFGLQPRLEKDEASSIASSRGRSPLQDHLGFTVAPPPLPVEQNAASTANYPPPTPTQPSSSLLPAESAPPLDNIVTSPGSEISVTPSTMLCAPAPVRDHPHSVFSTPTPPPSEPRAIRNLPKHPSYAKRREVEESIAKHREMLASRSSASSSGSTTPVSEVEAMIVCKSSTEETTPSPTLPPSAEITAAMREDNLRRLVLNSRKSRASSTVPSTPLAESPPSTFVAAVTVSEVTTMGHNNKARLDELAVSFITQSIQAASLPTSPLADRTPVSPIFSEKALLSAKQRVLEDNIADQKALMGQYLAARTKDERARLKAAMAARSRAMEQELDAVRARADAGREAARALRFKWPETDRNACILVISDDEGDE